MKAENGSVNICVAPLSIVEEWLEHIWMTLVFSSTEQAIIPGLLSDEKRHTQITEQKQSGNQLQPAANTSLILIYSGQRRVIKTLQSNSCLLLA